MKQYVVGVDLGGTKVEACLMDRDRQVYKRYRQLVQASQGMDRVIENIRAVIREVSGEKTYAAVGLGTPGTYYPAEDRLYGSPHTPVYETPGFIQRVKDTLKVPVVVENDANCLALAEFFASCEGKYRYVLAVIMGTGFGTGLILDNKLYRGARGGAGEIGHTTIVFNGRLCECGRKGCVEAYLSGPSLSRRFYHLTQKKMDVPGIYRLYQQKDPWAMELFEESFKMLAEVFANAVNTLDLEAIILGGGVSNIPAWYEGVPHYMKKSLFGVPRGEIPLIPARLGDSAGVLGAAYLALRQQGALWF
ncbi:MAG: ROK family protein [Candidatus Aminicenantes bacterium]|jgi:predicted NBD/HSP70 family sugar kinase